LDMNVVSQFPAIGNYDRHLRFQAMFQSAAIGIGICHLNGVISEVNPELSRLVGYSNAELAGTHILGLDPQSGKIEHKNRPENGGGVSAGFSHDGHLLAELLQGKRDSFVIEKLYIRKGGSELWGHLTVSLGRNLRHQPAFLIAMLADATERKRVEAHMREAEKMEVIGRLAGGIAHDFNNLLTGILLYCDLLSAGLGGDGSANRGLSRKSVERGRLVKGGSEANELCQHVEEVRMAGEQGAALTHQLLAIARKQAAEPRPIAINEIVASTNNLLRRLIGERIELVTVLDAEAGRVLADPAQLRQILLNLVLNARDAMPKGGTITLSTRVAEFPSNVSRKISDLQAGTARRAAALMVKDNGQGMDATTRARLFEPFFTTKDPGYGTGLGLATVRRVVSESGGTITVESEVGRGTSIEIFLPSLTATIEKFANSEDFSSARPAGSKFPNSNDQSSNQDSRVAQAYTAEVIRDRSPKVNS
jgi:two-component system, cell cycle sensor histidine kinase and response regulator CckA